MELPTWVVQAATILGVMIALLTFAKGVLEYARQNVLRRADHFGSLRAQLKGNDIFRDITEKLDLDDAALRTVAFKHKRDFLGLMEEMAISMNSGLIKRRLAHYMFGYYAVKCYDSDNFWHGVNRDSPYWSVFIDFALKMKDMETAFPYPPESYRY